jgi:ketosteroid isomerase-like protein
VDVFVSATQAGDADRIAGLYAPNAIMLIPNQPVVAGPEAIRNLFARDQPPSDQRPMCGGVIRHP